MVIRAGALGEDSSLLGAAELAFAPLLADPLHLERSHGAGQPLAFCRHAERFRAFWTKVISAPLAQLFLRSASAPTP